MRVLTDAVRDYFFAGFVVVLLCWLAGETVEHVLIHELALVRMASCLCGDSLVEELRSCRMDASGLSMLVFNEIAVS